ncbi:Toluene-4-sulfonate monooxygenase system iron-sulfur subunit TsaM1 [compost metagenome]
MVALHAITPETATTSHYFWAQTHDFRTDEPAVTQSLFQEIKKAFHEDLEIFALQQAAIQNDPNGEEISCRADRAQIAVRRHIQRLLQQENSGALASEG